MHAHARTPQLATNLLLLLLLLRLLRILKENDQVTGGSFASFCRCHSNCTTRRQRGVLPRERERESEHFSLFFLSLSLLFY